MMTSRNMKLTDAFKGSSEQSHEQRRKSLLPAFPELDLLGRADDTQAALSLLHDGRPSARVALVGLEGVGKTSLVLRIADKVSPEYEAVLWIDCQTEVYRQSRRVQSETAARAVAHAIRDLAVGLFSVFGDAAAMRAAEPDRAAMVRASLASHHVLVVADNLDGRAGSEIGHVLATLPGSVDVLATSTESLEWPQELRVRPFLPSESYELLRRQCGPSVAVTDDDLWAIAGACSGLPLVIIHAAQLLADGADAKTVQTELEAANDLLAHLYEKKWERGITDELCDLLLVISSIGSEINVQFLVRAMAACGHPIEATNVAITCAVARRLGVKGWNGCSNGSDSQEFRTAYGGHDEIPLSKGVDCVAEHDV